MLALKRFVVAIMGIYESTYLGKPTTKDLKKKVATNIDSGWPGIFASSDCMYFEWKNCLYFRQFIFK